ncbi:hypothetical protein [Nocardia sp. NPDC024068]|uniref:hypothetical protein n=1 Tax=Nocardia sp. NPDC024068 TaxID=3157197 RepID=UPI0033C8B8F0
MQDDNRLVLTAVVGGRDSKTPVFLPPEYREAKQFADRSRRLQYFCGIYLGGCGWPLSLRVCRSKKSHWAHHPDAPQCVRSGRVDSADHLYIHLGLTRLLEKTYGRDEVTDRIEMRAGRCLYTEIAQERRAVVRLQYSNLSAQRWDEEDRALRRRFTHVHWIIGPSASSTAELIEIRKGWVLRTSCRTRGGTRQALVRIDGAASGFDWIPLEECVIDETGRVTGRRLREQRRSHQDERGHRQSIERPPASSVVSAPDSAPMAELTGQPNDLQVAESVRPILDRLEAAMKRDDLANLESHLTVGKLELTWLRRSGLLEERLRLKVITDWYLDRRSIRSVRRSGISGSSGAPRGGGGPGTTAMRTVLDGWLPPPASSKKSRRKNGKPARTLTAESAGVKRGNGAPLARPAVSPTVKPNRPRAAAEPNPPLPPPLNASAAELEALLLKAARSGRTVAWDRLPGRPAQRWADTVRALVEVEVRRAVGAPLLAALIVGERDKVHRIFNDVLVALGIDRISSDFGLDLAGHVERERVHAYYARPPRPLPPSELSKKGRAVAPAAVDTDRRKIASRRRGTRK